MTRFLPICLGLAGCLAPVDALDWPDDGGTDTAPTNVASVLTWRALHGGEEVGSGGYSLADLEVDCSDDGTGLRYAAVSETDSASIALVTPYLEVTEPQDVPYSWFMPHQFQLPTGDGRVLETWGVDTTCRIEVTPPSGGSVVTEIDAQCAGSEMEHDGSTALQAVQITLRLEAGVCAFETADLCPRETTLAPNPSVSCADDIPLETCTSLPGCTLASADTCTGTSTCEDLPEYACSVSPACLDDAR